MSITNIIDNWSSSVVPSSRNYLIITELLKLYSKFTGTVLISLNSLDEVYNTFGWYIDKNKGSLIKVNLIIDSIDATSKVVNKEILEELKVTSYVNLNFHLCAIKRNTICDKRNIFEAINIHKEFERPEYFKLINFESEEVPITLVGKKRSRKDISQTISSKKAKKDDINWGEMISASSTRNYFLNDPLIDWIKEYNITSINDVPKMKGNSMGSVKYEINDPFIKFIMEQGCIFEEKVIKLIEKNHKICKVAESYQSRNVDLYKKTIELMKQGVPIIYQGILHNYENKTYGAPDLMIRSDYLNKFVGYNVYNEKFGSPKLGIDWHYVIVDIKHSQINLTSDQVHIRNDESIPAYKGQLLVYTQALNNIQGSQVSKAFIMGKKYTFTNCGITSEITDFMRKLGTIDYNGFDNDYVIKLAKAVEWHQLLRKEGHNWKLLPIPSREELFPNMKNDKDGIISKVKKELAKEIHEITSIYYCGIKNRKNAFEQGIFGWNDDKCDSKLLGFNEGKISSRVDAILNINRQNEVIVSPTKITCNEPKWRYRESNEMEFYLDYETMNSNFGSIIIDNNNIDYENFNFIFMIGLGYQDKSNKWQYKSFIAEEKTINSEKVILEAFWTYINSVLKQYKKSKAVFVHWSQAEKSAYDKSRERHTNLPEMKLLDLYQVFLNEPIVVKGALNYSLKSIAKALYDNKLIATVWDTTSQCANGLNAMLMAYNLYSKNTKVTSDNTLMKEIELYNEIDCKCLWEIIVYLRKNH